MKKILVTRSSMPPMEEYIKEIESLWESHWLTNMGEKHVRLQNELKDYLGVENIDLLTNGHMALEMSLQALDLPKGGEVITTPFTFVSTTHAIVRNGLKPVFCDIDPVSMTIDANKIEELITEKTCAILPVHVYGNVCNVEKIEEIAKKYELRVVYDSAHAFGERYKGKGIGSFGDVSCFSFHATKVYNTIEGGAVCFKEEQIGKDIYRLKNFGIKNEDEIDGVGANAKMNEFCAAMGICNLRHIEEEIAKRKAVYEAYVSRLSGVDGIRVNIISDDVVPNYAYFPIIVDENIYGENRDSLKDRLASEGIGARKYFYPITNDIECYRDAFSTKDTPVAMRISRQVLTLPMYSDLSLEDVGTICNIIAKK